MPTRTRPDHADPALRARVYAGDFARVWGAAESALRDGAGSGRTRVESHPERGVLRAEVRSPVGSRTVVELHLEELETGEVQVNGEAAPSTPFLDFGHSTRALRAALAKLDEAAR